MDDYDATQDDQSNDATLEREQPASGRRRSRRATRPVMTPDRPTLDVLAELGLGSDGPVADETPAEESSQLVEEQAEEPTPERPSAQSAVTPEKAPRPASPSSAPSPDSPESAPSAPSAASDESAESDENPDEDGDDDASPRLPATALLFQAPDLTPRRRRRASAPAGAPAAPEDEPESTPPTETRTKSQTRGRGRKKSETESQNDPADVTDPTDPTDATDESDTTDEAAQDQPEENEESQAPRRRRRRGGRGRRKAKGDGDEAGSSEDDDSDDSDDSDGDTENQDGDRSGDQDGEQSGGKRSRSARQGKQDKRAKQDKQDKPEPQDDAGEPDEVGDPDADDEPGEGDDSNRSRRRRRRRSRSTRDEGARARDEVTALKGSTRLEAKRQRRRDGRDNNRRRSIITEAEFLARREAVDRAMVVREQNGRTQIAVLEDDVLVEHFVARKTQTSMVGNVYLGRVQNVLPSMEAAFVDLGRGRNAVLYAGEVNWDAAGLEGQPRRIEQALSSGDSVLVQVTKDPIGHKGARLTSQVTLAGRYLVLVPSGSMTGISRKLPDTERNRLKKLLKEIVPEGQGVIVRTAAEGASEEELRRDVERLTKNWDDIQKKVGKTSTNAPALLKGEPELSTRVVRDVFNEDFRSLTVQGDEAWQTISEYVSAVAPDLADRLHHWNDKADVFSAHRIDEQLSKGMDRKVWLPSGGSLVIDRTEAMTVVDVNTGKFTGSGGTLEETVTRNNLEAAEEIVRQLRLRDIGGIIVIDFIDMVLESNRDLVLRRMVECLGRDRTRHQVAEVTSLGLVQMTRKRVGQGLVEAFSTTCEHCHGRGYHVQDEPVESGNTVPAEESDDSPRSGRGGRRGRRGSGSTSQQQPQQSAPVETVEDPAQRAQVRATLAAIAAAAAHAHEEHHLDDEPHPEQLSAEDAMESVVELDAQDATISTGADIADALAALQASATASAETAAEPEDEPTSEVDAVEDESAEVEPEADAETSGTDVEDQPVAEPTGDDASDVQQADVEQAEENPAAE